ncbi:neuroblast differentiation-associated protein AHNAK isoform X3 [Oryzias melastigma]|uniref:neuroblast differentiation-associated protein AHNAK isoform X3 n=1 Tax=Oryzias melastigma TaxID=30732 RepID=UPI00168D26BD|nr:neuroblast differentiation-associated protein AHNAK isoform X3 [Oryzias melastigma]
MDSEPTDEQTGVEDELKKSVEIVVETDAEVGASGYSVTGGGERGIFVKDVLKDSPAAKHLSLQQGDQLLSAKVYFENVRYEDALKILQCAEPYKVSFQLKRTVPETEVSVRPRVPGGEVKGPKAKVAKMSVKGTKLFKTQKRRGGRFGLKRLKEKNREELVIEGTPPRLEAGDVDVEFSLPKFKQRKGVQEAEPAAGKGKKRIRFPHMKTKSYTGAVTGGKLGTGQLEVDENIYPPETSRAGIKTKGKGHKFGIAFPKSKHNKSGSDSQTGSLERKPPEVRIHPPSVEFDVSSDKDVEKRGLKFKTPDVEFALPSGKAEASVSTVEDTSGSKAPKGDFRGEAEVAGGKVHADVSKGDAKLRMPKLKLPKVRLSRHSDEIDSAFKVKTPKAEIKGDGELQLPEGNIRMPKVEGDLSGGAASVQIPSVDISLPKGKGKFDAGVSLPESGVKAGVNMPDIEVAGSDIDLELTTGQKIPDEVESMVKGPKISMPKVDISLPKAGSAGVEGPDVGGKFSLPSVDISLPQMNSGGGDVDMDCYVGGDGKFKMPEFDPAFPNVKSLDGEGTFKLPKVDLSLPKGKAGTSDDDRAAFQLPSMEVSLPNMKGDKVEVNTKGGKLKMPEVEISPPKGHLQGGFEVEGKAGKKSKKGKKLKMPTVDVSMPKLTQPEGHIEGPEMTSGGGIQLPSHDASLPTAKMKGNIEIEGPSAKGGRFTMPSVNVKLPQMGSSEAGVDLHERKTGVVSGDVSLKPMGDIEGKVEGEKFTLPSVDVSLPKMKLPKGDVTLEGPDLNLSLPSSDGKASGESGGGKFKMPSCDISLQKGKVKEGEVNIRGPEAKGGKFQMPSFDVSLPQMKKRGGDVDVELPKLKGGDIKAPTIEISGLQGTFEGDYDLDSYRKEGGYSLPGMKFPEGEGNFQGPKVKGAKFEMPKIDLSLPRGRKQGGDFDVEVYSRKDGSIEMPSCDFDGPKGELSTDINVDGLEGKTGKFKMPKIDISLPKLNLPEGEIHIEGPEIKGQMEKPSLDITPPEGKLDVDIDSHKTKGSKFHMPTINVNLPKIKSKEVSIDVKGPEGPEGKLPSCDITVPDKKFPKADVSLEGPNVKGGHVSMPGVEVSLPKTKGNVGISVDTPEGNGEKLQMPKFDISLPKVNFPESAGKTKKIDLKTKKMEMPDIDVSLPKGKAEADIEIDGGKGRKFHIPSVDFSLPRIKTKGSEIKTEGVEGKVHVPDTDVSLSKGKVEVNTNVEGGEVKGGKFKMPKFDISFPNMNLPEGKPEVDVSITKGKIKENVDLGGKFPTVEISPPKIQARDIDVGITTPEGANLDISLPKASLPGGDIKVEGPNIKGPKIEMPDIDLSLPKGKGRGDIEITGGSHKGGKFHMPAIDITLPKMKTKGADVHVEGPEVKGGQIKIPSLDVSGPKLKSPDVDVSLKGPEIEGQFKKPKGDISLPKGEVQGDFEVEGPDMKGGKFKMPKFDVSLPKVSLPKFDANIEGPDVKGKAQMPNVDISVPKATTDVVVDVGTGKGSKFHMPSLDISLPKVKTKGPNVNVEGPEVRGDMSLPEIESPDLDINLQGPKVKGGNLNLPTVDVAFPKTEGDFEVEGPDMKGGKFKMPKFDVSLPKVSLPKFDANIEGPDVKGKAQMPSVDISVPKATADVGVDVDTGKGTKFHMPSFDISLPKMKTKGPNINLEGPEVRGDMSLPKITSPEADINLQGPTVEGGNLSLPTVDVAFPTTEGDFEVEGPDMKGGKFKMPKFDVSLPKVSLPKFDANIGGPDVKGKVEMPNVDISVPKATTDVVVDVGTGKGSKFHVPSLDISLPKMKTKGPNINLEGPEVRGDMSLPEIKSPDLDINLQGPTVKGGNLSLPTVDVAFPKTEGDFEVEGPDMKGGKFKVPKFDVSLPKVSLPKFDANIEGPDVKGKAQMPSVDISVPKATTDVRVDVDTGKGTKFHMPSFDISLPKIKAKGPNINLEGPEVRGDMSLPKVKSPDLDVNLQGPEVERGDMNMPTLDVSLSKPEGEFEVQGPGVKGGKIKMPKLPKVGLPEVDVKLKGPDINVGKIEMPDIDISLPKGKVKGDAELEAHTGKRGKFHMPAIDISLPKIKTKEPEINIKGPEVKGGKIPDIDLSLPRGEVDADLSFDGPEKKGGHLKMPKVDVSLPQIKLAGDVTVEGPEMKGKTNEPAVGFSKGDGQMEGDLKKGLGLHMPNIDLHLPKLDFDLSLPSGSRGQGLKVETGGSDASADVHIPGTKGQLKPPKVKATDASINTGSEDTPGASLKLPTVKLPTVDISAPKVDLDFGLTKSKSDDVEVELLKAEGGRPSSGGSFDLPDVSLKVPGFNFPRFGGKSKSSELQISKPEVSISPPDVEGELRAPSVEFDDEGKVKVKKPKIKMPTFGISRKNPDVSVSCPEVDVKAKKEYVDIPTPNINVEGSDDRTKYKVKLPKFKISSPKPKLPEKEGDVKVEADGKGGFHAPDVTIKLPKFSMPGFGSKEKDLGKPVGEVEAKTKLKMPSVELSLPETKTPDTEVLLPKAEVDVSEADIKGYEGNLKVPKMPKIDISIPKVDLDVSLPKGKSQKIEKPDTEVKGEGKFKIPQITMPSLDVSIPKGKSGDYDSPDVEVDVDRGKFNMPYVKMPSVDITFPKPKTGKPLDVDVDRDGNKLRMPDIKMPNVNISKENSDKLEGPDVDVQGRGKLKMPNVDINLSRGKKSDVNAPDLETPDVTTEWDTDRRFKMPSVDISLPKGKLKGNNPPDIEMGVQGEGKVKLPHVKMPDFDVSFPKRRSKDPQMEIKEKDGNLKTPNVSTPSVDFSLSTGKDVDVEESSGGKFKLPHWKMPDVDISLPKGHVEGPEEELTREKGGLKMPHIRLPSVDISLPKGRADGPNVERGDGEEKFSSPYTKMPSVDISVTKGKSVDPNVELKGEGGTKFQMPHVKMPNVEFSLPKGKDVSKFEPEGEKEKLKMPSVDISMPTGKIHSPKAEVEGGKLQGPHIKMPHVNISLPKGKSDKSEGAKVDYSPEIKGERKKFKMVKEDISLPKGRVLVEGPEVDMKGDASMASAKAEGGNIKLPHMKFPKVDISLPKGRSKGSSSPAMEMSVTGPEGELPKVPSSKADIELPSVEAQGKLRVPQGAHLDSSSEGDHDSLKLKIPTIQIKGPKEDLELETGSHKEEGNKVKKSVELPDLDLTLEGSSDIGKGPKTKGGKFKIRKHKKKTGKDASTKPHSEDEVEERVKHNSSKDGKDDIIVQLPGVTPPSVSLKPSTADVRVPRIPDIEFDIGTSQDEDEGRTENKIKIPKFGIPLPSISSPERLAHGPEVQYEGPKIPKVKKAVFVLVNPSEPDASATSPSLQREQTKAGTETEEVTVKMSKKKMKTSFGKSKDKSATESAERKAEEEEKSRGLKMKMPKVKFSPAKSGSSGVKGDKEDKDASPHKDDKGTFGGKLKLPKVELTSPYGKMAAGEENKGARLEKEADRGLPAPAESAGDVVSSQARTEMLDRDSSESPEGFNMEFSSAKVQMWSDSKGTEERESSSWFKVPKVTLKPLSSGFLQITPEGSPQAQRKGEVAGVEDVSGSFCIHSSELDFTAQQMSEERHVSTSEEGTVTTVTKATRIARQLVTSQTRTAESSTTTTRQVSDFNF